MPEGMNDGQALGDHIPSDPINRQAKLPPSLKHIKLG